jgi:hypothetical protein
MINSKLSAATVAGAVSILIVAALAAFGILLDPATAQALTTLIAFAAGYMHKGEQTSGV